MTVPITPLPRCRFGKQADGSYYFEAMAIKEIYRNMKLGSNLVEQMNYFLKSRKAIGYLNNTISEDDEYNLYVNHGWKKIDSNRFMFDGRGE